MKNWQNNRPDGWDKGGNPRIDGVQYHNYDEESYEAGADAMYEPAKEEGKRELLKAIWKLAQESPTGTFTFFYSKNEEVKGMNILLTQEESLKVWNDCGDGCAWGEYAEALNKAQLKKVVGYLAERSFSFQPGSESAIWVISCDKKALLKEAGVV